MEEHNTSLETLKIKLGILKLSSWEHHKFANELVKGLGPTHPKFQQIQATHNKIIDEENILQKNFITTKNSGMR